MSFGFSVLQQDSTSAARLGRIECAHGAVETPAFMPVGTQGSVKAISPRELDGMGCQILLDLGLQDLRLLTSSSRPIVGLEAYGLKLIERISLKGGKK